MSDDVNTGHILSTEITPTQENTVKFDDISRNQESLSITPTSGITQKALNHPEIVSLHFAHKTICTLQILCIFFLCEQNLQFFTKKAKKRERKSYLLKLLKSFKIM